MNNPCKPSYAAVVDESCIKANDAGPSEDCGKDEEDLASVGRLQGRLEATPWYVPDMEPEAVLSCCDGDCDIEANGGELQLFSP